MKTVKFVCMAALYFITWLGVYLGFVDMAPRWSTRVPGWLVAAVALVQIASACFVAFRYSTYRNAQGSVEPVGLVVGGVFFIAAAMFALFSSAIFWIALYGM